MNFGENLKILRKNSKMSQEQLADKMGVTRQSVSKWEVGDAYPEMSNIVALCSIFHCNINDLINDDIVDKDSFSKETQEDIVKFKLNQQKNMKRVSKSIYILANICRVIIGIPTVCILLLTIIFPFLSKNIKINEDNIEIFNNKVSYSIDNNILEIDGEKHYIESNTNIKEFVNTQNNTFFIVSIEYILICVTILSTLTVLFLHSLYKLYKNIYEKNTPFTLENEKLVNRACIFLIVQTILTKVSALVYSIAAKVDLQIEVNIKDLIILLVAVSIIYIFKYGRLIQADSKSKIYN